MSQTTPREDGQRRESTHNAAFTFTIAQEACAWAAI
jgi:hypothetical protein